MYFKYPLAGNIALEKQTQQSSDYPSHHPVSSSLAVDGNTNPNWYSGSCSRTSIQFNPWWMVDLGREYPIDRVLVTSRGDCEFCVDRIQGFEILIGNEGDMGGQKNDV